MISPKLSSSGGVGSVSPNRPDDKKVLPRYRATSAPASSFSSQSDFVDLEAGKPKVQQSKLQQNNPNTVQMPKNTAGGSRWRLLTGAVVSVLGFGWMSYVLANRDRFLTLPMDREKPEPLPEIMADSDLQGVVDAEDEWKVEIEGYDLYQEQAEYEAKQGQPFTALSCANQTAIEQEETVDEDLIPARVTSPDKSGYPPPPCTSQWPDNVEVLTSSSQNHFSYTPSFYSKNLRECIDRNGTETLGQCHSNLRSWNETGWQGKGYLNSEGMLQFPVSSADAMDGWCLNTWNKQEPHKQRFALLLGGNPHPESDWDPFERDYEQWATMLKKNYPQVTTFRYDQASAENVSEGLQKIATRIQEQGLTPENAEVMIYYSGHAEAGRLPKRSSLREGEATGFLLLKDRRRYSEDELRNALETHFPNIPTLVVLDACQSGAFIG